MTSPKILLLLLVALLLAGAPAFGRELKQAGFYIFGYGSLLYDVSRIKTNCKLTGIGEASIGALLALFDGSKDVADATFLKGCDNKGLRPVRINGVRRGWYAPGTFGGGLGQALKDPAFAHSAFGIVPTYLGAVADPTKTVTGLMYEVTAEQFDLTVQRELAAGYTLVNINLGDITLLDNGPALDSNAKVAFFANTPEQVELPSERKPICSTYVDIWLAGAIEISKMFNLTGPGFKAGSPVSADDFVAETIITTDGWKPYWVNDRYPVYRPFVNMPYAFAVDQALYANVPKDVLRSIKFPGQGVREQDGPQ